MFQPKVMIYTNYDGPDPLVLGKDFEGFECICMMSILVMRPGSFIQTFIIYLNFYSPFPRRFHVKALIGQVVVGKIFESVNDGWTDGGIDVRPWLYFIIKLTW